MSKPTTVTFDGSPTLYQYIVKSEWGWGNFIIDPSRYTIMCYTSYGSYAYGGWSSHENFFDFLVQLDYDYTIKKFIGRKNHFDAKTSAREMRRHVLEYRREDSLTAEAAKAMWDAVKEAEEEHDTRFGDIVGDVWSEYDADWFEYLYYTFPPDTRHFWDELWVPLMAHIKKERF